jgi:hypothetical protein
LQTLWEENACQIERRRGFVNTVTIPPNPDFPSLFDAMPQRPLTLKEQFSVFHVANPHVYKELEALAQSMVDRGRTRLSSKMLFEVLRWNFYLRTDDPESEFVLNNNHTAYYSRLLMDNHPEWPSNIFQLREVHENKAFLVRKR